MIRQRTLTVIAMATLIAAPLAACTTNGTEEPTATPTTQEAPPSANPADATPQERVQAYFDASDAAAAEGWKDSSYADEYLVPEVAEKQKAEDETNTQTGAIITGDRKLSHWTVVEETDTNATIEFCDDTSELKASKDGEPYKISNAPGKLVAQYKLVRESTEEPWMIEQKGYYEEGTSCESHFAG